MVKDSFSNLCLMGQHSSLRHSGDQSPLWSDGSEGWMGREALASSAREQGLWNQGDLG